MSALARVWKEYQLPIVMISALTGLHIGWRAIQNQTEFVPAGTEKEYPWLEIARHVRHRREAAAAEAAQKEN